MFGSLTALLAVVGLAALSAGGIAYTLLYGRIQTEDTAEKRLEFIQGKNKAPPSGGRAAAHDPNRRRKSIQDTLKELEAALECGLKALGVHVGGQMLRRGADAVFQQIAILGRDADVAENFRTLANDLIEQRDAVHFRHMNFRNDRINAGE